MDLYYRLNQVKQDSKFKGYVEMLQSLTTNFGAFFRDPYATEPQDPDEDSIYREIMRTGLQELMINVTEKCNLRCRYCVYSGIYENQRVHGLSNMDTKTALKAIDMYFKYLEESAPYNPIRRPSIRFYGGEPLINFKLIKEVVNYIEDTYPDYNVKYTLTTNATLLNLKWRGS